MCHVSTGCLWPRRIRACSMRALLTSAALSPKYTLCWCRSSYSKAAVGSAEWTQ